MKSRNDESSETSQSESDDFSHEQKDPISN
jgi:hypothetical protein